MFEKASHQLCIAGQSRDTWVGLQGFARYAASYFKLELRPTICRWWRMYIKVCTCATRIFLDSATYYEKPSVDHDDLENLFWKAYM